MTKSGPAVALLRRLAGRVPDEYLQVFRGYLAAAEWDMLVNSLSGYLVDRRIALTPDERHLLDEVAGPEVSAKLPDVDTELPAYRFMSTGPDPGTAENWLISVAPRVPGLRRVLAACREPANSIAIPLVTWVYLVETDPGADVARLPADLRLGDPSRGVVEVFATGEPLPPYHVEALRAAREVWVRDT